jgi:hypothetical protein
MRPAEVQIGKRVRVRMDYRKANLRGKEGIISRRWANPYFTALDVLLDDGNWQLFWDDELAEGGEVDRGARCQDPAKRTTRSTTRRATGPIHGLLVTPHTFC